MIKATDRYTDTIKTMRDSTAAFTKDMSGLESRLNALNRIKPTMKLDAKQALEQLRQMEKQFERTGNEADGLKLQLANENYENIRRNLSLVTKEAANVERQMVKTGNALSKTDNKAGSIGGFSSLTKGLASAGLIQTLGQSLSQGIGLATESYFGQPAATMLSSIGSGIATGAAAGAMLGPYGALAGAAIGGVSGLISGGTQVMQKQDEAFKGYVQNAYDAQMQAREASLTSGSSIASQRQTDRISFATLFKSEDTADQYLSGLVDMANNTPFLYGDLTAMSKTLATYQYSADEMLPVLQTIGDAGAALGQSTSDMSMVATAIGRMRSSDKATLEYLNILNDRGIGAVGMLSEHYGVDQGTMYGMISKGSVSGREAAQAILDAMTESFSGSMLAQSQTFSGLTSTVEGLTQEMDNAMGEGYNQGREEGLAAQRDWLSGISGERQAEASRALGAWQASLENSKEAMIRDAVDNAMNSNAYRNAQATGDAAEMGRIISQAKVQGMNEYNASEGAQLALESERALVDAIRNDAATNENYWNAGYERGNWFSKGLAARLAETGAGDYDPAKEFLGQSYRDDGKPYAYGLDYVPYDNFPALLHQGERVQTAAEARGQQTRPPVTITGNTFNIREEADVGRVALKLLELVELAEMRG